MKLLDSVSAASVTTSSKSIRGAKGISHIVDVSVLETTTPAATQFSALTIKLQGSQANTDNRDGVVTSPRLAVGSTAEDISHAAFDYRINDIHYSIALDATLILAPGITGAKSTTPGDYVIALDTWGGFKVYVNAAGTVAVGCPATAMSYATNALVEAAIEALPDKNSDYISIGKVVIEADGTTWTMGTDDLTQGSDNERVLFADASPSFTDLATHVMTAAEIINKRAIFQVNVPSSWVRFYVSSLTGTVEITADYTATEGY